MGYKIMFFIFVFQHIEYKNKPTLIFSTYTWL